MFLGSYSPSFDKTARRIALPVKIRAYLAKNQVILSYGFEKCLFGFDLRTWQKESDRQLSLPLTERRSRDLRRFFFAHATPLKLDDQGRFVIPGYLLEFAKIRKPIVIGAGDHFEIWDQVIWQKAERKLEKSQR